MHAAKLPDPSPTWSKAGGERADARRSGPLSLPRALPLFFAISKSQTSSLRLDFMRTTRQQGSPKGPDRSNWYVDPFTVQSSLVLLQTREGKRMIPIITICFRKSRMNRDKNVVMFRTGISETYALHCAFAHFHYGTLANSSDSSNKACVTRP